MEKFNTIGQLFDYTIKEDLEVYGRNEDRVYVKTYGGKTNKHTVQVGFNLLGETYE